MKCANCNGAHNANSKECSVIQKVTKLEKDRVLNRNPSAAAPPPPPLQNNDGNLWPNLSGQQLQNQVSKRSISRGPLYSQAVAGPSNEIGYNSSIRDGGPVGVCSCKSSLGGLPDHEFFLKLKKFVLEIFSMISAGESEASKSILANCALRNSFGVDLTEPASADMESENLLTDPGKKRPLNSTDEFLSGDEKDYGVLSDHSLPNIEDETGIKVGKGKSPKRKKKKKSKRK